MHWGFSDIRRALFMSASTLMVVRFRDIHEHLKADGPMQFSNLHAAIDVKLVRLAEHEVVFLGNQ